MIAEYGGFVYGQFPYGGGSAEVVTQATVIKFPATTTLDSNGVTSTSITIGTTSTTIDDGTTSIDV